jgi:phage-related baseplate assembly protein
MASRYNVIALDQLAPMAVLEAIDTEVVLAARMAKLKELWALRDPPAAAQYDVQGLEFDPIKINQEAGTWYELLLRDRVNQAARAVTLAFATGSDLDAIASRYPGGVPRLPGELDDRYRRRIWLSPNALTPHGNPEAYAYWALTADPTLRDATATTIEGTGLVQITILPETDSMIPPLEQLLAVRRYILAVARKGLTDVLSIRPPKVVQTRYVADVWLYPGPDKDISMAALQAGLVALVEKQRWLGFDHTLTAIDGVLSTAGTHHAVIKEPATDLLVDEHGVVHVTDIALTYRGVTE